MTTKQQERDALAKIQAIIAELGGESYVGTALGAVLHYADENIDCDAAFTAPVCEMQIVRKTYRYASRASNDYYAKLAERGNEMSEERAKMLINDEFGFEASRIKILCEAEVDTTEAGARSLTCKKVPRKPLYCSTDYNYVRFNVRGCAGELYFEMVDGQLYEVFL